MCLATVYKESDNTVIMQNAARIDVDGDTVTITDIIGDETKIQGRILMVDLANSVVKLVCD
ncbi:MAG: CooT family nickel-binding protein [Lachnospiraceae bacterium]|jgi:predicted RNA-binding protein|uniref:CooT family nickel-binding protein n=1 Tax=Bilifractor porci TaxID=2606636 RepID=A0A7X2P5R8_9FIRM|nr:CooT family nickel-binding protein [Bilifractor porci]MCI2131343.1 CooT family nickel-binding protein [Eubacterium sp.]MCI6794539.1 CooT family nickel-binding protein [Lachnospiraceae bacterium]MDD6684257.1 CooT family nickel-binding protein [Lachnospiraceae bacterium]MDD7047977.1 CooT family nickel-binding protein [Lachnospiraceae bacterium]MST80731.1 CooT family nickel-binding protein [Bilifractor porci]